MSDEKVIPPYTTSKAFSPKLAWYSSRIKLNVNGSCLKQENKAAFSSKNMVNLFISYELDTWSRDLNTEFFLKDCLFGAVKLAKNANTDKYKYSGYDIRFDSQPAFSLPDRSLGKNFSIFGADMDSSVHIDTKGKDILTLGVGPVQGLDDTTLTAEAKCSIAKCSINFTQSSRKFCLSLHYNGSNSFLFVNATKYIKIFWNKKNINCNTLDIIPFKCVSMSNQEYK